MNHEEDEALVELTAVQGEVEYNIIKGILEGGGIEVLDKQNMAHGTLPFTVDGIGEVKIYVRRSDLAEAREVLRRYREGT